MQHEGVYHGTMTQKSGDGGPESANGVTHRKLRTEPGQNRVSDEAFERGQALYSFLVSNDMDPAVVCREMGVARSTLWRYINGEVDLLNMRAETIEKLLTALGVSDTWAWGYFKVPQESRAKWRTFRPPPLGHGEDPRNLLVITLPGPTLGRYYFREGDMLTLDQDNKELGVLLAQQGEQYFTGLQRELPQGAEVLGEIVQMSPSLLGN